MQQLLSEKGSLINKDVHAIASEPMTGLTTGSVWFTAVVTLTEPIYWNSYQ